MIKTWQNFRTFCINHKWLPPPPTHTRVPPPPPPPPASWYCQIKLGPASHGNTISQHFASFSLCPGLSPPPTPMITCTNSIPFIVSSTNARNTVSSGSNPSFWCIQCLSFCCRWLVVSLINIYKVLSVAWVDSPVLIISGRWGLKVIGVDLMNIIYAIARLPAHLMKYIISRLPVPAKSKAERNCHGP